MSHRLADQTQVETKTCARLLFLQEGKAAIESEAGDVLQNNPVRLTMRKEQQPGDNNNTAGGAVESSSEAHG